MLPGQEDMADHMTQARDRARDQGQRTKYEMKELLRTNDPVMISYIEMLLREQDIEPFVLDTNASILEGSIGILPRRITVANDEYDRARMTLRLAGLEDELGDPQ